MFNRSGDGIFDCHKGSVPLTVRQSFSKLMHVNLCAGDQRTRKADKDAGRKIKRRPEYQKFKALTLALLTVSESDLKNT